MLQRRTKKGFSSGLIALVAAAAVGLVVFVRQKQQALMHSETEGAYERYESDTSGTKQRGDLVPEEWFFAIRNYPDAAPSLARYTAAMQEACARMNSVQERSELPGFSAPWVSQGPNNIGARINTIKVHPTNQNIIYVGYSAGGVWKTTDGGQTWRPVFDQQPFLAIGDIELDPRNPEVVYVGTGDPNISGYPFIGDGLWRSTNGGQTWQNIGLQSTRIISRIIPHPTNSNILYVATMGLPFQRDNNRGLYKTSDGGRSWQQILFFNNQSGVIDLEMDPKNPDILYAAGWDRIRSNRESVINGINSRIWKTTNGGQNWTQLTNGLPSGARGRIGIAISTVDANQLVAIYTGLSSRFEAIYESLDGGQQWKEVAMQNLDKGFQADFSWYFGKIFINPFVTNDIWALGISTWRSTNFGGNWTEAIPENNPVHVDHHDMAFLGPNRFLVATDGGLFRSDDGSQSWRRVDNIPTTQFYRVAYNPFRPELYYGGTQDNGTISGNGQGNWRNLYWGDGFQAAFHPTNANIFYYEWQNGNIVATTDGGQTFVDGTAGILGGDRRHWDMQYFISNLNPDRMFTGTQRAYAGTGHPTRWTAVSEDLTDGDLLGARFHTISTIDENRFEAGNLYVGTTDGNVWRGNANTQTWQDIRNGLPDRYVSSVRASPTTTNRVFVSFSGYKDNDFRALIYRSDNRGDSWQSIGETLPPLAVNDLLVLPGSRDSVIFAATDGGVYGTIDGGKRWERLGRQMPMVAIYHLGINPVQKTLVAGTYARSILTFPLDSLRTRRDVSTAEPGSIRNQTMKLYPTLASESVTVRLFNLRARQTTQIAIYDMTGRQVWQQQVRNSNQEDLTIPLTDLPTGPYVAVANTEGVVWSNAKFVVVR
jgi:photosystem II stability/assembly factor-like uncharacterized protein